MHLGTRSLTLTVGGYPRSADVSDCRIVSGPIEPAKRLLYGSDRGYRLQGTAAQDPAAGSLWDLVWESVGTEVEIDLRPNGGVTPTDEQPWFTGTVTIAEPDGDLLGGPANASPGGRFTFDIDWAFTEKPTRVSQ